MPVAKPTLRERQQAQTRDTIIDALIDQLAETGAFEYSVFEVARRAGVSVRTVYRHFPDREALLDEMARRVNRRIGLTHDPIAADTLPEIARHLFRRFDDNATLVKAQREGMGSQVRAHARKERIAKMSAAVDEVAPNLDVEVRRTRAAVMSCLFSAEVWLRMREEFGFDGARSGDAVAWALATLRDALADENKCVERKRR